MRQDQRTIPNPNHRRIPHPSQPAAQQVAHISSMVPAHPPEARNPDIVPDHEDHPLDWSEESVAHSLDLRQKRSLSSFM